MSTLERLLTNQIQLLVKISICKLLFLLAGFDLLGNNLLKICVISIQIKIPIIVSCQNSTNDQCVDLVMHYSSIVKLVLHLVHLLLHCVKLVQFSLICLLFSFLFLFFTPDLLFTSPALTTCLHDHSRSSFLLRNRCTSLESFKYFRIHPNV